MSKLENRSKGIGKDVLIILKHELHYLNLSHSILNSSGHSRNWCVKRWWCLQPRRIKHTLSTTVLLFSSKSCWAWKVIHSAYRLSMELKKACSSSIKPFNPSYIKWYLGEDFNFHCTQPEYCWCSLQPSWSQLCSYWIKWWQYQSLGYKEPPKFCTRVYR